MILFAVSRTYLRDPHKQGIPESIFHAGYKRYGRRIVLRIFVTNEGRIKRFRQRKAHIVISTKVIRVISVNAIINPTIPAQNVVFFYQMNDGKIQAVFMWPFGRWFSLDFSVGNDPDLMHIDLPFIFSISSGDKHMAISFSMISMTSG